LKPNLETIMQTTDSTTPSAKANATKPAPPGVLFIGLLALGIITVLRLFSAMARPSLAGFFAVVCNLGLILGLLLGHRWAYVVLILFSIAGIAVAFGRSASQGLFVLLGDGIVVIPVILCTHYFFSSSSTVDDPTELSSPNHKPSR
jgi:hypothetical protein